MVVPLTGHTIKKRNQYIAFAKAYGILTIVIYHFCIQLNFSSNLHKIIDLGGGGVHLFIFASGFGLFLSKYTNFKTFLKRRVTKVLIPYYAAVSLIFIANSFLHLFKDGLSAYLSHLFLDKMFIEDFEGSFGGQFWFISTIIQFYLVFPFLLKLVNRYNSWKCLFAGIIISVSYSLTISALGYGDLRVVNSFFIQYLWEFVLGMIIAKENLIDRITDIKWFFVLIPAIAAYAVMALLVICLGDLGRNINDVFSFIGYTGISLVVYHFIFKSNLIIKTMLWVEGISYSLFLLHTFVYVLFEKYVFHSITIMQMPIILLAAIIVAWLFNWLMTRRQGRFIQL